MISQLFISVSTALILTFFLGLLFPWFRGALFIAAGMFFVSLLYGLTLIIASIDLIIIFLLIWYGLWYVAIALVLMCTIIQTMRYYNDDIFADDDECFIDDIQEQLELLSYDPAYNAKKNIDIWSRRYPYVIWSRSHICTCQPCILYSSDGQYRALIYHTQWMSYFFFTTSHYRISYELNIDDNNF